MQLLGGVAARPGSVLPTSVPRRVLGGLLATPRVAAPRNFWAASHIRTAVASDASEAPEASTSEGPNEANRKIAVDPTWVKRSKGIKDGKWNGNDVKLVKRSISDSINRATTAIKDRSEGGVILGMTNQELEEFAELYEQPKYRGKQLKDGILKGRRSVEEIHNIPKAWREAMMADGIRTGRSKVYHSVVAPDGTTKYLLQQADGRVVETVAIPADQSDKPRLTVCVSSQVGCPMRCTFCATGKGGFARNLRPNEIVDQVLTVQEEFGRRVSNVVFMGMGEPMLNLPGVVRAFEVLNKDVKIGARSICISTVGVPNTIRKLARERLQLVLAISLHAPNQKIREQIIPSSKVYLIDDLLNDVSYYFRTTGRRVTFEYILLKEVNDEIEHAEELVDRLRHHRLGGSHINLIPWNPVSEGEFARPNSKRVRAFQRVVEDAGFSTTIRKSRGLEAAAACGQLRNEFQKNPLDEFSVPL